MRLATLILGRAAPQVTATPTRREPDAPEGHEAAWHDNRCERAGNQGRDCHCGSRKFPLCWACKDGRHHKHDVALEQHQADPDTYCVCDLCTEAS